MAYRRNQTRSRAGNALSLFNTRRSGNNFRKEGTGIRRHNINLNIASGATAINADEFLTANGCLFKRSFHATDPDVEPVPTNSNNYVDHDVMNGSNIYNHQTTIKIQNEGAQPHFLNVYETSLAFADTVYAKAVYDTFFPYDFPASGSSNNAGIVLPDAPSAFFNDTIWRNFMGIQRHIKKLGTINIGTHDAGDRGIAELNFTGIPPKCRKSQTGMYYGWILQNDSVLNGSTAFNGNITQQTNFDEVPSSNRIPYKW